MKLRSVLLSTALILTTACSSQAGEGAQDAGTKSPPSRDPGVSLLEGHVIGDVAHPGYTVEVPNGWSTEDGGFMVKEGPDAVGLSVWDVGTVPRHPCHWRGTEFRPGSTVDDLVEALTSQELRDPTAPTEVTLAGYEGRYFDWSVPDGWVVTGDSVFKGCDDSGDFVSWWGTDAGQRYQQAAGQVDRLWVLDVDGQTLLVDATYTTDASAVDREELEQVAASLRFVDA